MLVGDAREKEAFEDAHPFVVCLGHLQLLSQIKGGGSEDAGKSHDLVGQLSNRYWQKEARAAWLEADAQDRRYGGRIEPRKGTSEHTAMKLVGMLKVCYPNGIMAWIDHQGYLAIEKAAFFPGREI